MAPLRQPTVIVDSQRPGETFDALQTALPRHSLLRRRGARLASACPGSAAHGV